MKVTHVFLKNETEAAPTYNSTLIGIAESLKTSMEENKGSTALVHCR